jgi:hypothetical protein
MTPPKCRICGAREHNHRCQGGTAAMRIEERARVRALAREGTASELGRPNAPPETAAEGPVASTVSRPPPRRRWHDDTDSAGEPAGIRDPDRRPARFYAPPGQCVYCDRRRDAARRSMAAVRERGTDA